MLRQSLSLLFFALPCGIWVAEGDETRFEADVRPILKAHCFQCHGEAGEKKGGLDLRLRRLIVAGGDSGPAVVPDSAADSLLLERVQSGEMPPGDDRQLSSDEIRVIEQWIQSGAKTARAEPEEIGDGPIFTEEELSYWAFQPVRRPRIPQPESTGAVLTPIDAFLLEGIEREGVAGSFAPPTSDDRLIRRATLDLLGLPPPIPGGVGLDDMAPDAYLRQIDRLLASPHYGERWGRHWLDVAGYADSEGYTDEDRVRPHAYRYRDYVIRAFNDNKPFDQFIVEQLAGDELVERPYSNLSPDAIEKLTATGFLRMAPDGTASGGIDQAVARNQVMADTLQIVGTSLLGLTVNCAQCHDHRYDPIPQTDYYRLRAVFEPALDWKNWQTPPARQISLYTDADREAAAALETEAAAVEAQRQQKVDEYLAITLEEELLLIPDDRRNALRTAFNTAAKDRTSEQTALLDEYPSVQTISAGSLYLYDRQRGERAAKLDAERERRLQQYLADATAAGGEPASAESLATANPVAAAELERYRTTAEALRNRRSTDDLKTYTDRTVEIRGRKPVEHFLRAITETTNTAPATFVFHRGDHEQPTQQVGPGDLSIFAGHTPIPDNDPDRPTTGRRLAFARHLTSGTHPLVARVIVNRLWLHHFGRGLVPSPGDFGVLGERPAHPELLDWLAAEFVRSGWDVKRLHRLIMTSAAYCQESRTPGNAGMEADFYASFPVRRLESEVIRDATLAVCDQLNDGLYGEPVPVMEDAVGRIVLGRENLDGERKPTQAISLEGEEFRRSVYVQVRRTRILSMFETFDAPSLSPNCSCRNTSTVTPQSLLLMNSDFAVTYADAFARRLIRDGGDDVSSRVSLGWRLAYGSAASPADVNAAVDFISDQHEILRNENSEISDADVQREALAVYCQALLSSNRFLYVD